MRVVKLTKREYYADFFITPPITLALIIVSIGHGISTLWCAELITGFLGWSIYEYVFHRWVLHRVWFFRDLHELHHTKQTDYIALHPALTLILYCAIWSIFGFSSSAVMIGFSIGYIIYSIVHTCFHHATIEPGHWLYGLKMRHVAHHRTNVNFGVTTGLWDRLFNSESK